MSISLDSWRRKGQEFCYRSHPVFFLEEGSGPAILLIHGFPTSSWDWSLVWPELTRRYRCIAVDMVGFGYSAKPYNYPYSILDQADLLECLLAALHVRQSHILAHDYGDTVAQELLARFIDRQSSPEPGLMIESACLLNGGLFPETHHPRLVQKLLNSPVGVVLARLMDKRSFSRSFAAVFGPDSQPTKQELEDFWHLISLNGGSRIAHKLIRYMDERQQYRERWVGALQQSPIPLRLINGPVDPVSGLHMTERYRELVPNPDIVLLDAIGHYPQVEDPAAVSEAYLRFLNSL